MKKKLLSLLALTTLVLPGLASCNPADETTNQSTDGTQGSNQSSNQSTEGSSTPGPVVELPTPVMKGNPWVEQRFNVDKIGSDAFKLNDGEESSVTVEGYYVIGGDGNYAGKGQGTLLLDDGSSILIHSGKNYNKLASEIQTGTRLKVTGDITVYHGLPQIQNYDVEIIEDKSFSDLESRKNMFHDVTETEIVNISKANNDLTVDWALKPVEIPQMVNITTATSAGLSEWMPLDKVTLQGEERDKHIVQIYRPGGIGGAIRPGSLYDVFGSVNAYNDVPQLFVGEMSKEFKGLQPIGDETLEGETLKAIVDLRSEVIAEANFTFNDTMPDDTVIKYDYSSIPQAKDFNPVQGSDVSVTYELDDENIFVETAFDEITTEFKEKSVTIGQVKQLLNIPNNATQPVKDYTYELPIKRKIKYSETETVEKTDIIKLTFTQTQTVKPGEILFLTEQFDSDLYTYHTNNPSYPNPAIKEYGDRYGLELRTKGGISIKPLKESNQIAISEVKGATAQIWNQYTEGSKGDPYTQNSCFTLTLRGIENKVLGTANVSVDFSKAENSKKWLPVTISSITRAEGVKDDEKVVSYSFMYDNVEADKVIMPTVYLNHFALNK